MIFSLKKNFSSWYFFSNLLKSNHHYHIFQLNSLVSFLFNFLIPFMLIHLKILIFNCLFMVQQFLYENQALIINVIIMVEVILFSIFRECYFHLYGNE